MDDRTKLPPVVQKLHGGLPSQRTWPAVEGETLPQGVNKLQQMKDCHETSLAKGGQNVIQHTKKTSRALEAPVILYNSSPAPVNARLVAAVAVQLSGEFSARLPSVQVGHAVEVHVRHLEEDLLDKRRRRAVVLFKHAAAVAHACAKQSCVPKP